MQTYDPDLLYEQTNGLYDINFFEDWVSDLFNVALKNENDDVALFEYVKEGFYTGHYFFNSRGKKAVKEAKAFLEEIFDRDYVQAIQGLTPLSNRPARWFSRHIGFQSLGVIHLDEPCEHFMLTKRDYNKEIRQWVES